MKKLLLLCTIFLTFSQIHFAQNQLTSLTSEVGDGSSEPSAFVEFGNSFVFSAKTTSQGIELWISDGTVAGTKIIKDINPGYNSSLFPRDKSILVIGDYLYFLANDGIHGIQIWKTDGTEEGTIAITFGSAINGRVLTNVDGKIYYLLCKGDMLQLWKTDGTAGNEQPVKTDMASNLNMSIEYQGGFNDLFIFSFQESVWRSDGTEQGTFSITDEASHYNTFTTVSENKMYFLRNYSQSSGNQICLTEIYETDGSKQNTKIIVSFSDDCFGRPDLASSAVIGNKVYFSFFSHPNQHSYIYETDGIAEGTKKIYDNYGPKYYSPSNLVVDGQLLIFTSGNINGNTTLFKLDTETYVAEEISVFSSETTFPSFFIDQIHVCKIKKLAEDIYHIAVSDGKFFEDGWASDLTSENTYQVDELYRVTESIYFKNEIYLSSPLLDVGVELVHSNSNFTEFELVKNINKTGNGLSVSNSVVSVDNKLFFRPVTKEHGFELWMYDYDSKQSTIIADINSGPESSNPRLFFIIDEYLHFQAKNESGLVQFYKLNINDQSLEVIPDFLPFSPVRTILNIVVIEEAAYFLTSPGNNEIHLYRYSNGESKLIKEIDININANTIYVSENTIYFKDRGQWWFSDGTTERTTEMDFLPFIDEIIFDNGYFYFSAKVEEGAENYGLWKTDGTSVGTTLVKSISPDQASQPTNFAILNNKLIFSAATPEFGRELWVSDGSAEGTNMIKDINSGELSITAFSESRVLGEHLYFPLSDGSHGMELWKTDGTEEGTMMVKDVNEGGMGSFPENLKVHKDKLYFSAYTPAHGQELFETNGIADSTLILFDLVNGKQGSLPQSMHSLNEELVFMAISEDHGFQYFDTKDLMVSHTKNSIASALISIYPNPSADRLYFKNTDIIGSKIEIFDMKGGLVDSKIITSNSIEIRHLPIGNYTITIRQENNFSIAKFTKI